ncbi:hypothetical protein EDB84DRAFT_210235 [Lactarius hengduanensis]|nr:hypothetical protein EDB84DRAFT_210235 [Lactarius hengduanensis]
MSPMGLQMSIGSTKQTFHKQVFFTWLDEFFARYLDQPQPFFSSVDGPNISTPSPRPSRLSRLAKIAPRRVRTQAPTTWTLFQQHQQLAVGTFFPCCRGVDLRRSSLDQAPAPSEFRQSRLIKLQTLTSCRSCSRRPSDVVPLRLLKTAPLLPTSPGTCTPSTLWDTDWYASNLPIPLQPQRIRRRSAFRAPSIWIVRTKTARGVMVYSNFSMCWYFVTYGSGTPVRWDT